MTKRYLIRLNHNLFPAPPQNRTFDPMGLVGFEPTTFCLEGSCSVQAELQAPHNIKR